MPSHEEYISTKKENIRRHKDNNIQNESVVYFFEVQRGGVVPHLKFIRFSPKRLVGTAAITLYATAMLQRDNLSLT